MTGQIVHTPPEGHSCRPGWEDRPMKHPERIGLPAGTIGTYRNDLWTRVGTVWACDVCGATWVATYPHRATQISFAPTWVREGRLARWWRERRNR